MAAPGLSARRVEREGIRVARWRSASARTCPTPAGDRRGHRAQRALDTVDPSPLQRTSMLPYYMTPETREAVIAESNRLIADRAANARRRREMFGLQAPSDSEAEALDDEARAGMAACGSESAFARLVADLAASADSPLATRAGER
jgi:hypothetical protein